MPTKLDYLQPKKFNPTDELREILNRLEESSLRARDLNPARAQAWLAGLDQAYSLLGQLGAVGSDLLPEQGRFKVQEARLRSKAGSLLKALGGPAALAAYRPQPPPDRERWWWYIHELVAARQEALLRQVAIIGAATLLVVGGLIVAFNTFLAPSPEVVARLEAENDANAAIDAGSYSEALAAVKTGLEKVPGDPGLLLFQGVLQQVLGEEAQAEESFTQAQAHLDDLPTFYLGRGQLWLRLNRPAEAEQDARAALARDETQARAWLILGQALERQDKLLEAVRAYEEAGNIALAQGDNESYVLARLSLARLESAGMGR